MRNDSDCKDVVIIQARELPEKKVQLSGHFFIKKVLDIFEKQSCRKFGSHCFGKIKKPNKNFLKLSFNKKIRTKLSFPPQQKN